MSLNASPTTVVEFLAKAVPSGKPWGWEGPVKVITSVHPHTLVYLPLSWVLGLTNLF